MLSGARGAREASAAGERPLSCKQRAWLAGPGTPAQPRHGARPERGSPEHRVPGTPRSRWPARGARQGCGLCCETRRQGHGRRPLPDPVPLLRGAAQPGAALCCGRAAHAAPGPGRRLVGRREGRRAPWLVPRQLRATAREAWDGPPSARRGEPDGHPSTRLAQLLVSSGPPLLCQHDYQ